LLHYRLQCTVYNSSARAHHTFPITAYFKNGQRWANFPPLGVNTHVFLSGRIFRVTKENRQLAVITDDIPFLPIPTLTQPLPPTPSSTIGKRKRHNRWSQRASPSTPSKSSRLLPIDAISPGQSGHSTAAHNTHDNVKSTAPDDDGDTLITWPDTADETISSPQANSPTPGRRSQRARKTSYADVLALSKHIS
jgi:hypothetical protein